MHCRLAKVNHYNRNEQIHIPVPKFSHVHLDIVGEVQPSNGYRYLLTMTNRYIY